MSSQIFRYGFVVVQGQWLAREGPSRLISEYSSMGLRERITFLEGLVVFIKAWGCQDFVVLDDFNLILI